MKKFIANKVNSTLVAPIFVGTALMIELCTLTLKFKTLKKISFSNSHQLLIKDLQMKVGV